MKTKWYLLILLTVVAGFSLTVARVEAATLDFYGGIQFDDGGGEPEPPAEYFPITLSDDGGGEGGDGEIDPAE